MEKKYRIIFHIDLNAFFASCEMAQDESLRNIPIGIGGKSDRGVLTTANYVARKHGVKSAMSSIEAKRLCPEIKLLPVNFPLYTKYSEIFFSLLYEYTENIEKASIDEAYLDVTDICDEIHPLDLAKDIQERLNIEHKLPVSIGIAPNMFLAKMASDMKKPLGITVLRKRDVEQKLWPLPIEEMHGIGKKTYPNLKLLGVETIGDMVNYHDQSKIKLVLGNSYEDFINKSHGIDQRVVTPDRYAKSQSIGNMSTFSTDIYDYQEALSHFNKLARNVTNRLQNAESIARTVTITIKYNDFKQITRSKSLDDYTDNFFTIYQIVEDLFDENQSEKPIRLLGVSVSNIKPYEKSIVQLNIFDAPKDVTKEEQVIKLIQSINDAYGVKTIERGVPKDLNNNEKH
ncbi:DNA polymerase IV [Candidatus Izimaplasma bacterium ZiA1]|uniref:DNA polymerase IV n=1 Tax=Candidatus Izimoplasma sp. ZiA1 TaxID=2024899 RepID=UPI000BAA4B0B|nr:DNA polymerase IV [Candidatus Izimaplasma bacterium ZiA1]